MSLDIVELIEEEKRAEKTLEEARKKANKILEDAKRMAKEIVEKAMKETFFQDFIDKRTREIDEKRKIILKQFEDECEKLTKRAEKNLSKVADLVLEKVLGVKYE
ncbi:MAG: V-type ATPase subunit subunit G family protein [Nitrososphaerales archaeon]